MNDEVATLEMAARSLREMIFYARHCGMAGAQTGSARAQQAVRCIQARLDQLEIKTNHEQARNS